MCSRASFFPAKFRFVTRLSLSFLPPVACAAGSGPFPLLPKIAPCSFSLFHLPDILENQDLPSLQLSNACYKSRKNVLLERRSTEFGNKEIRKLSHSSFNHPATNMNAFPKQILSQNKKSQNVSYNSGTLDSCRLHMRCSRDSDVFRQREREKKHSLFTLPLEFSPSPSPPELHLIPCSHIFPPCTLGTGSIHRMSQKLGTD